MTDPHPAPSSNPAAPIDAAQTPDAPAPVPAQSFAELGVSQRVLDSLAAGGFTRPTPIQSQFIPLAMTGQDVMGQAKTGTGKTAAFLVPIFERLKAGEFQPQALILAPTRELALQIHGEILRLGDKLGFTSITLYGGSSYEPQIEALATGVDIIVATPGRLMDHMRSNRLDMGNIKVAVLDEADRMLDLGFRKDIEYILRHCPEDRQTLLLSATIADDIKKLSKRFMYDPLEVWTAPENLTVDAVEQFFCVCERTEKLPILLKILDVENPPLAIIFCGTKIGAKKLAERLKRLYISAREIHGDLQQSKREKIMSGFRTGKTRLLIATDVASRGIDVQNITHIINYDIPYKIEDYVHRIGRTGRMEKSGKAYTLVTREEASYLTEIELLINREIHSIHFEDLTSKWWPTPPAQPPADFEYEPTDMSVPESRDGGRKRGGGGGGGRRGERGGRSGGRDRGHRSSSTPVVARSSNEGEVLEPQPVPDGALPQDHNYEDEAEAVPTHVHIDESAGGAAPPAGNGSTPSRNKRRRNRGRGGAPISITCAACGKQAEVRFKPDPSRPVYCDACYAAVKAKKAAAGTSSETAAVKSEETIGNLETRE